MLALIGLVICNSKQERWCEGEREGGQSRLNREDSSQDGLEAKKQIVRAPIDLWTNIDADNIHTCIADHANQIDYNIIILLYPA